MTRPTSTLARPELRYGVAAMLRRARLLNQLTNFGASIFGEQFEPLKSCCELHEPPGGCEQGRRCPLRSNAKADASQKHPDQIRLPTGISSLS